MPTPDQARKELARRELARRELARRGINPSDQPASASQESGAGPTALERAVQFVSPINNALGTIGSASEKLNQISGYNLSPFSQINRLAGLVQQGVSKVGDVATEAMGKRGVNPYLSASLGLGINYLPDAAMSFVVPPIASAGEKSAALATRGMKATAKGTVSPIVRATAGVPIPITNAAIENPSILTKLSGTEASVGAQMSRVIDLVDSAKRGIGSTFGRIYRRYAQMEGPMQEIIDTPIAQKISPISKDIPVAQKLVPIENTNTATGVTTKSMQPGEIITEKQVTGFKPGQVTTVPRPTSSYDDLLINNKFAREAFVNGDEGAMQYLYKKYVSPAADLDQVPITNSDKLQILTRLKREIQSQAKFNKEPITLRPIDPAKDAAFKRMASEIDDIRGGLPNGEKLALVDDAWKEINDIYGTIQKDLADPGKARDTFLRLFKGDTTWLTSGRFANKLNAIKKVEKLTGQKILEPALNELTAMVFKEPFGRGLISSTYPLMAAGSSITSLFSGNPMAAAISAAAVPLASPRAVGLGLRGAAKVGRQVSSGAALIGRNAPRLGFAANRALKTKEELQ